MDINFMFGYHVQLKVIAHFKVWNKLGDYVIWIFNLFVFVSSRSDDDTFRSTFIIFLFKWSTSSFNNISIKCNYSHGFRLQRFSIRRGEVWRPLVINGILLFIQRWSGVSVITSYAVTIMTDTKSSINEVVKHCMRKKYVNFVKFRNYHLQVVLNLKILLLF